MVSFIRAWMLWDVPVNQWWHSSWVGRVSGILAPWATASWVVKAVDPLSLVLSLLYLGLSTQANTTWLGILLVAMVPLLGARWLCFRPQLTPVHLALGLVWGITTLATLFSPVPHAASDGWLKFTLYLLGFLLWHDMLQRPSYRSVMIGMSLLGSLWLSVYGLRQYFYGADELATWVDPESGIAGTTRVYSHLLNPNLFGGYLVGILPLGIIAIWYWSSWGMKALAGMATLLNLACLLLTYSRGAWLGAAAGLSAVVLLLVQWSKVYLPVRWRRWSLPAVVAGGALTFLTGVVTVEPLRLRILSVFAGRSDSSNNFRINVWLAVVDMIKDFPILGIGPGNDAFNRVYPLYQRPNYSALGAYSVPLEVTAETGLVGLTVYLWFFLVLIVYGGKRWIHVLRLREREGLWIAAGLASCVGIMTHGLVDTIWYRPQVQMLWWLAVALITSVQDPGQRLEEAKT